MFCEKLFFPFPFKEGRSTGRQKAEQKSTAHMLRFYPCVEHGMRKCNVVPLSGYSEFHGAWCILASTIVHMKNKIDLEKLKENKGKLKETKDCAACQVSRQGYMFCKLNQKNASEETIRPLCLLNCHCEINCISHPTSICAQNFLLHLVTSNFPSQHRSKISRDCKLPFLFGSAGVSSGSAAASADNKSIGGPFTSASLSNNDDVPPSESVACVRDSADKESIGGPFTSASLSDDDDVPPSESVACVRDSADKESIGGPFTSASSPIDGNVTILWGSSPRGSPPIVYSRSFLADDDNYVIGGVDTSHLTPRTPHLDEVDDVVRQFENEKHI
jgi:hypothetical protein